MRQKQLYFLEGRLSERSAEPRAAAEDRLPVGIAMTIIAGASTVLWSLIAIAINSVL